MMPLQRPCQSGLHLIEEARQLLSFTLIVLEEGPTAILTGRDLLLELAVSGVDLVLAVVLVEIMLATLSSGLRRGQFLLL